MTSLDKVRGMFLGVFLGDALGAPHEFGRPVEYTGILQHETKIFTRAGTKVLVPGQVTDDSEMTLALLRSIIQLGEYNKENVLLSYLKWANSKTWMMGKNTRQLFKGVTTIRGYKKRYEKILELPEKQRSQSNGSLMRASPLALLFHNDNAIVDDVLLSNPNPINTDCSLVYVNLLRLALKGVKDKKKILKQAKEIASTEEVKILIEDVEMSLTRDIATNRGWCMHSLWCALMVMLNFDNYSDAMKWVIDSNPKSDTDTNAAISGALLGAMIGFDNMLSEDKTKQNIHILLNADYTKGSLSRPAVYSPHDFYEITEKAYHITLSR